MWSLMYRLQLSGMTFFVGHILYLFSFLAQAAKTFSNLAKNFTAQLHFLKKEIILEHCLL
jgi:hypothetical protein